MRTTLAIDDDVLVAAKALAERQRTSLGTVISDLARQALRRPTEVGTAGLRNGIRLLPARPDAVPVTLDVVNQLRDDEA